MSKFRISIVATFILAALICAVWAVPNTSAQKRAKGKCDRAYDDCYYSCYSPSADRKYACRARCYDALVVCYGKIGISAPPRNRYLPPNVPTTQLQPTSSPTSTPKSKVPTSGPLTQASPSATPKRLTRQPQGTFTQTSPSASPKSSPTTILKKKKKDH